MTVAAGATNTDVTSLRPAPLLIAGGSSDRDAAWILPSRPVVQLLSLSIVLFA
jgi:hypothetical protein